MPQNDELYKIGRYGGETPSQMHPDRGSFEEGRGHRQSAEAAQEQRLNQEKQWIESMLSGVEPTQEDPGGVPIGAAVIALLRRVGYFAAAITAFAAFFGMLYPLTVIAAAGVEMGVSQLIDQFVTRTSGAISMPAIIGAVPWVLAVATLWIASWLEHYFDRSRVYRNTRHILRLLAVAAAASYVARTLEILTQVNGSPPPLRVLIDRPSLIQVGAIVMGVTTAHWVFIYCSSLRDIWNVGLENVYLKRRVK